MKTLLTSILSLGMLLVLLMIQPPAMALSAGPSLSPNVIGTMSKDIKATAKNAEGKLQSAMGELTGDNSMKVKGEVKQGQAAAMSTTSDLKRGAKKAARQLSDAADRAADKLS